ncbi:MAG: hypothetical protein IJ087_19625 [Eggerthellaceae bacterium]|nr:hypothetical protein [Eggerthellaceae bacterium]
MFWGNRALAAIVGVVLAVTLSAGVAYAATPYMVAMPDADTSQLTTQASANGWRDTGAGRAYFKNGSKVVGLQKIEGSYYYFNAKGVMRTSDIAVSGATFFIEPSGKVFGAKYGGTYFYGNLKPMTGDDAYDFDTYIWARAIVDSISSKSDSSSVKLWKAFAWVKDKSYAIHQNFSPYQTNWPAVYARYHFNNQGGDCHSDGAAFAYLAAAIGYPADVCIDSWGTGYAPSHCWAMIGNAVYDPLFYESKGTMYYGATSGTYETTPTARFRVPRYSASHNKHAQVSQALLDAGSLGLKKISGKYYYYNNGQKLKSTWKTIDGRRYYFKANGAAATLSTKVNGSYYVFSQTGVLQKSTKSGKRIVTLGKESYQVTKSGKAAPGWSANKKKYAKANGLVLKKTWKTIGGKRYYFAKDGVRATDSTKVDGTYYVFGSSGALQKASGKANKLVTVGKRVYRVNKKGEAVASEDGEWLEGDMLRFDKTGCLLTGVRFMGKEFYAADKAGTYLPDATAQLNAAVKGYAKRQKSALDLRRALDAAGAKLKGELYSKSCDIKGYDGLWQYAHFSIVTARPAAVEKMYKKAGYSSVKEAIAALDAAIEAARAEQKEEPEAPEEPDVPGDEGGETEAPPSADSSDGGDADSAGDDTAEGSGGDVVVDLPTDMVARDGSFEYIRSIVAAS